MRTTAQKPGDILTAAQQALPFKVEIETDNYIFRHAYDTAEEALTARDRAFDLGFSLVRVLGLPLVAYAAGFAADSEDVVLDIG